MTTTLLTLRADHAGSLVVPEALEKARRRFAEGAIPREALEDAAREATVRAVGRQRDCGLPVQTDGGYSAEDGDFFAALIGVERVKGKPPEPGAPVPPDRVLVTERLGFPADHPLLAALRDLVASAGPAAKVALPSPGALHRALAADALHVAAYREEEQLFSDLRDLYGDALAAIHATGCRLVQFDDDAFFALAAESGEDSRRRAEAYAGILRGIAAAKPADLGLALFLGAGRSEVDALPKRLDAFAELVLAETGMDSFLVEPRAVPAAALRFLPSGKRALLGLVDAGSPRLERLDLIRRAVDAAGEHTDAGRLGLASAPGFAEGAEPAAADVQWRKLDLVVQAAERIWGDTSG